MVGHDRPGTVTGRKASRICHVPNWRGWAGANLGSLPTLSTWCSWGGDTLVDIGVEPGQGGFCFERGPQGWPFMLDRYATSLT
jgi:hypothetical protein